MLHECYVRLDQSRLNLVVAQARSRIERPDVFQRLLYGFDGAGNCLGYFLVLLILQRAKMLVHNRNRIREHLGRRFPVAVLTYRKLVLVVMQLTEQALAQTSASHSGRIHLAHQFERFMQIAKAEVGTVNWFRNRIRFGHLCNRDLRSSV